ncbi:hypothetical protein ACFLUG_03130 [Chloroflexota bacterium]
MSDREECMLFTWLKLLMVEIVSVDTVVAPIDELEEGETEMVQGYISEGLRKLFTLWRATEKRARLLAVEREYTKMDEDSLGEVSELNTKARMLEHLFWYGVKDEFGLWGRTGPLAVRAGWKVVVHDMPDLPSYPPFGHGNQY